MILTPSQIKFLYDNGIATTPTDYRHGKFHKGVFDLSYYGLPTNWQLMSSSTLSAWIKANPDVVRDDYHIFGNDKLALVRNDSKIAVVQNIPERQCILWNKMKAAESEIGPDGVVTGGSYVACKFNNGFQVDADSEYFTFSSIVNGYVGCVELWLKPVSSFDDGSTDRYIWTSVGGDTYLFYDASANAWVFTIGGQSVSLLDSSVPDSTLIHIAASWNYSESNKAIVFRNSVQGSALTTAYTVPNDTDFRFGNSNVNTDDAHAILDNIKVWNYAKTDFSDREVEDAANFTEGDNGITIPSDNQYFHIGCRINDDQTFDLFLDGVKVHSSTMKIPGECFEDIEEKFWPEHWWRFDEGSGTVAYDSGKSGGKNGTISGSPSLGQIGKRGNCFDFVAASSQYVDIGDVATNMKSISFWAKLDSTTEELIALSGAVRSIEITSGTITATGLTSPDIYIDGVKISTFADTNWHMITVTTATAFDPDNMDIGRVDTTYLDGLIDDVRLFINKLSIQEVRQLYEYTNNYYFPQPRISIGETISGRLAKSLHWWKLNERSGLTIKDYGISKNDGAITGGTVNHPGNFGSRVSRLDGGTDQFLSTFVYDHTNFTVSWWMCPDDTSIASNTLVAGDDWTKFLFYTTVAASPTTGYIGIATSDRINPTNFPTPWIHAYEWQQIVFVYDGTNGNLYRNGQLLYAKAMAAPTASFARFLVGNYGGGNEFSGKFSNIKIYDFDLTLDEIRQLYTLGRTSDGEVCDIRYDRLALSDEEIKLLAESNRPTDSDQNSEERYIRL